MYIMFFAIVLLTEGGPKSEQLYQMIKTSY